MTLVIPLIYLVAVLVVGAMSHRLFRGTGEDYFLATRTIGPFMLLMSLFGTHMTAFSLLGASGEAYRTGIGVFGLMASSSALVVPVIFFTVGTRLWKLGKRYGYHTQIQYFRERFESEAIGVALFVVLVALLIPYLLIGVMGSGLTLAEISGGQLPQWVGSLAVCVVVMTYVVYGGLRGTAWANTFQTLVFMALGGLTYFVIVRELGGVGAALDRLQAQSPELLVRGDRIPPLKMFSYAFIPLSAGMFPHLFMHWLTARRMESFRVAVVGYPLCVAIVWLPSVMLGLLGRLDFPDLAGPEANSVLVRLIDLHAPDVLAGFLAAGVFAAIMSSLDSQVLSLGTVFTKDFVGRFRGDEGHVLLGRLFVAGILLVTFLISLVAPRAIFKFGVWSFTGYSALFPLVLAGLFWRRATRAGVLASIATVVALWIAFFVKGFSVPGYTVAGTGVMPVVVVTLSASLVLVVVSLLTRPPSAATIERFFSEERAS